MGKMKDIAGQKFGLLIALYPVAEREPSNGVIKWYCQCECGNYHIVNGNNLRTKSTTSCGCARFTRQVMKN